MKIYLLTHEREISKPTNTGILVSELLGAEVERVIWQRKQPNSRLESECLQGSAGLLYPRSELPEDVPAEYEIDDFESFVVLDATWQEARKIYNKSPYLQAAKKVSLVPKAVSTYQLRRNQKPGGLSTAESVIEVLRSKNRAQDCERLARLFDEFNNKN